MKNPSAELEILRRQAWDSAVMISYVTGQHPDRQAEVQRLLEYFRQGRITVVISTFAIAEVRSTYKTDRGQPVDYDEGRIAEINEFLEADDLEVRVVTERIAILARDIGNEHPELKPADCVHIATALDARAHVLFTYDGVGKARRAEKMLTYDRAYGDPPLRILKPFDPYQELWTPTILDAASAKE